jgi:hypothetical protein
LNDGLAQGSSATIRNVSGFQLTASLASSLAWPVVLLATVAFVWFKRSDLVTLFESRKKSSERPLKRFKAGPVEFEWEQLIDATSKQISAEVLPTAPDNLVSKELDTIVDSVPTAAVLEGSARVEQRLRQLVSHGSGGNPETGRYATMTALARTAFEERLISEETYKAIDNLRRLRNEAAHRVGGADITADQAREYLQLVDRVLKAMTLN